MGAPQARTMTQREALKACYARAVERRDTRAQHDRWPALRDATHAALRQELTKPVRKTWLMRVFGR